MSLIVAANAPRPCRLGAFFYFVGRLTPFSNGVIQAFLDRAVPGKSLSDPEGMEALHGQDGRPVLLYAALYRHNAGFTLAKACRLEPHVTPEQFAAMVQLFFEQSREGLELKTEPQPEAGQDGTTHTVRSSRPLDWPKMIDSIIRDNQGWTYEDVIHLSYGQIACVQARGKLAELNGTERELSHGDLMTQWRAVNQARYDAGFDVSPDWLTMMKQEPGFQERELTDAIEKLEQAKREQQQHGGPEAIETPPPDGGRPDGPDGPGDRTGPA